MDMSRYLDLFLSESREHLGEAHSLRSKLEQCPVEPGLWQAFMRHAHSLKSMAAPMHFPSMVELTHAAEALAERLADAPAEEARAYLALLDESLACLGNLLDRIERGDDAGCPRAEELARKLRGSERPVPAPPARSLGTSTRPASVVRRSSRYWQIVLLLGSDPAASAHRTVSILGRIGGLGRVVQSGPPSLALDTGRFQGRLRLVVETDRKRSELERELSAIAGPEGFEIEVAPEPAPAVDAEGEPAGWIRVRSDVLDAIIEGLLELRHQQGRLRAAMPSATGRVRHHLQRCDFLLKELYGSAIELHLVPFETVTQRMHQNVLDLARELDKQVHFEIDGGEVRLDRLVLDKLIEPLLHALKNAVDHGLEPADERRESGKPARGTVRLSLNRAGDRVHIVVADDGRGMRPTTRRAANHVSGRGVGLDVVREQLESIGGFVEIRSEPGRGCELRMSAPLRRALIRTLLVRCAGESYAVPLDAVVKTVDLESLETDEERVQLPELVLLIDRLGLEPFSPIAAPRPRALILASADPPAALVVDEVIGRQDLVVQPLHAPLSHLREYTGAALLEDGSIIPVLDPLYLVRS
jgi:two-component system chemotaxis sensor kinase CheA